MSATPQRSPHRWSPWARLVLARPRGRAQRLFIHRANNVERMDKESLSASPSIRVASRADARDHVNRQSTKKSPAAKRGEGQPGSQGLSGVGNGNTMRITVSVNNALTARSHLVRRVGFEKVPPWAKFFCRGRQRVASVLRPSYRPHRLRPAGAPPVQLRRSCARTGCRTRSQADSQPLRAPARRAPA